MSTLSSLPSEARSASDARQLSDDVYPMVVAASATLMATLFWTTSSVPWLAP